MAYSALLLHGDHLPAMSPDNAVRLLMIATIGVLGCRGDNRSERLEKELSQLFAERVDRKVTSV